MTRDEFFKLCRMLKLICNNSSNEQVQYHVLQLSKFFGDFEFIGKLAKFYNYNWVGNNDFIHIPNIDQIVDNMFKHPIIVAIDKNCEILGVSTLKCEYNGNDNVDPYFPYKNTRYLSVTGILTKKDNIIKGIGKKIYEISLVGSYLFNEFYSNTRLMCVIDCRNNFSLDAAKNATIEIEDGKYSKNGLPILASLIGYYEVHDEVNEQLLESPTIVLEFLLKKSENILKKDITLSYDTTSFYEHLNVLKNKIGINNIMNGIRNYDEGVGYVDYFEFYQKLDATRINIVPGISSLGNNREIVDMEYFHDGDDRIEDIPKYVKRRTLERCMIRR